MTLGALFFPWLPFFPCSFFPFLRTPSFSQGCCPPKNTVDSPAHDTPPTQTHIRGLFIPVLSPSPEEAKLKGPPETEGTCTFS